jgi:Baseplate J-like protein
MSGVTSVPPVQFTLTGLVVPTESQILAGIQDDYNAAFGGNLNPALNTPQGQLESSTTAIVANANATFAEFVNQVDPDTASGFMQDAIARIYFINRLPGIPTSVVCTCVGIFGTVIPVGAQVQDTSGNIYLNQQLGTIPVGGSIDLEFACNVDGPTACPANTVTTIYQAIPGWESVNNAAPGVAGSDVESRAAFEFRRQQSVAINASGSLPAIYAALFNVPGVIDVYATQNATGSTVDTGSTNYPIVPHSLYAAVTGGSAQAVANAIWQNANIGAGYPPIFSGTGSQSGSVVTISARTGNAMVSRIEVGMTLSGAVASNTVVTSFGTYTNTTGTGTLNVSTSGTVSSGAITGQQIGSAGATLVSETVQDNSGYSIPVPQYQVNYITPASTPIKFAVQIANSTLLPANIISLVQQAIIASFNGTDGSLRARIGSLILASKYYAPVSLIGPEVSILSILIGISTATLTNVQMGIDQQPTITVGNIGVSLV